MVLEELTAYLSDQNSKQPFAYSFRMVILGEVLSSGYTNGYPVTSMSRYYSLLGYFRVPDGYFLGFLVLDFKMLLDAS